MTGKERIEGPETAFRSDAQRIYARIRELEGYGTGSDRLLRQAREHVDAALILMDEAFARLR